MATSILAILAGLVSLAIWFFNRKSSPTKEERLDDIEIEYTDCIESVHRLRSLGKHDQAEAMLARMRIRAAVERMRQ
jgi:hypothetical protein